MRKAARPRQGHAGRTAHPAAGCGHRLRRRGPRRPSAARSTTGGRPRCPSARHTAESVEGSRRRSDACRCRCGGGCGRVRGRRVPPCPRKAPALWNATHARPGDCRRWQARDHLTIQRDGGGTCRRVSDQGLERRGLPGPVAARHREDLALPDVEADIVRGVAFPRGTLTVSCGQATLPRWPAPRRRGDGRGARADTDFLPSVPSPRGLDIAGEQHLAFVHHGDMAGQGDDPVHAMCAQQHRQVEHDRLDEVAHPHAFGDRQPRQRLVGQQDARRGGQSPLQQPLRAVGERPAPPCPSRRGRPLRGSRRPARSPARSCRQDASRSSQVNCRTARHG